MRICYSFETPLLQFYGSSSSSELQKLLADGRPPSTLRGRRDLAVFRGLCSDRNRIKAINYIYKRCQLSTEHDGEGFMAISAIALLLLSCKVE